MNYRFILTYKPTDSETTSTRTCFPLHNDDLSISIDRAEDEWYYTRKLDGKLVFERDDYAWIMDDEYRPFDGTFTLDIKESHDNGATWFDYFTGTFSRASLEIDEDNHQATLNGLKEGVEDLIKNGAKEDYDLMKIIPDSQAREVQGQVPPALAMVDYRSASIDISDVFCGGALTGNGYKDDSGFKEKNEVVSDAAWNFLGIYAECRVTMKNANSPLNGDYCGILSYETKNPRPQEGPLLNFTSVEGVMSNANGRVFLTFGFNPDGLGFLLSRAAYLFEGESSISTAWSVVDHGLQYYSSPSSFVFDESGTSNPIDKIEIYFHYIRATLLTQSGGNSDNVLDTGNYYKRMAVFNNDGGLITDITTNTSEQPNGHRMVPGSDEYGGTPQYFAPPNTTQNWIPLAEDNWNFASMWYTIEPSPANGLTDPNKYGSFAWTRCWTIGTCIKYLLQKITNNEVNFAETTDYSQFLYGNPNPVQGHEPFQWLVTQKSNVMHPAAGGASRCIVRLDWFFELLRNAFNCYYWFEKRNDGRYDFRIEHVEYFRRGGAYNGQMADQLDLTRLKPIRNFLRNNIPAKRYADGTNKYTFDLDGMVEKYTYSWQGEGGGDDFHGNPMYFKAGWIEKGSSEDHQVDNIFADLGWLMLNAGTDTASSKNYDGLFIFGGYRPFDTTQWKENEAPLSQYINNPYFYEISLYITMPAGYHATTELLNTQTQEVTTVNTYTGTGKPQAIVFTFTQGQQNVLPRINFDPYNDQRFDSFIIHRIHARSGNVFRVPNVENMLRSNNYLQNGVLAWPWLQCEYLHYDIPAAKWAYDADMLSDVQNWQNNGTIKMVKKQTIGVAPFPTDDPATDQGVKTGLGIGIIDSAKINLSSRNAEMTIIYDINPQNN